MGQKAINPELRKQLNNASATEPVEASVTLAPGQDGEYMPPEEVGPKVKEILHEVAREVGEGYQDVNVLENLGTFVVRAAPAFLEALLKRPEVAAAMANRQSEDMLIRPVRKGPKPKS